MLNFLYGICLKSFKIGANKKWKDAAGVKEKLQIPIKLLSIFFIGTHNNLCQSRTATSAYFAY